MRKTRASTATPLVDLEGLLVHIGVRVDEERTNENEVYGWCPGHKKRTGHVDRSPSWSANRETGRHNCFSCGYHGDLVNLVIDSMGTDAFTALRTIRAWGANPDDLPALLARQTKKVEEDIEIQPEALLEEFVLPPRLERQGRGLTASACAHYGVLWEPTKGGWILPIRTPEGDLMGYQIKRGAWVRNRPVGKVKKGRTLFGIDVFPGGRAIVVESPLDAVRLESVGIEGGLAFMGVNATVAQMNLLEEYADSVILALDNDGEGRPAMTRLLMKWASRITMKVFNYGDVDAKDPGDMSQSEILWAVDNAIDMGAWRG